MRLPRFTPDQLWKHGKGVDDYGSFGCWSKSRLKKWYGKRRYVTAWDLARYAKKKYNTFYAFRLCISMLNKTAIFLLCDEFKIFYPKTKGRDVWDRLWLYGLEHKAMDFILLNFKEK